MTDQNEIDNEVLDEVTTVENENIQVNESSTRSEQTSNSSAEVDLEFQNELRKVILGIQNDLKFNPEEKAKKIQDLMTSNWRKNEEKLGNNKPSYDHNDEPTYVDVNIIHGEQRYKRNVARDGSHADFVMMKNAIIILTGKELTNCNNCDRELARYYCEKCKFWDDSSEKDIYHCDACGICRKGVGLGIDKFHCEVCDCCLDINVKGSHKCIEKNMDRDCAICGEYLFTSTITTTTMRCGHIMHSNCYEEYTVNAYQCPTCWKSIGNMEFYFQRIDAIVAEQKMPPEYDHCVAYILCNDCEERSTVKYHFLYHKCHLCKGYNTKLLETRNEKPEEGETSESEECSNSSTGSSAANSNLPNNGLQVRQSRVMEITAMMQGEEGPVDDGNATEHRTRNPLD
ncbi:11056_t:CDS:2 [Acaulospora morrowiae]|uniref:11056_t:CDS:1 n=1 Tax=Acaulospora morrowiae TaxID=94023 RepID=A0A9N8ZU71_9GLOM|nr:11056_t:CDS:2 [Acaulospora morrowiae]